jgi:hypothetical protein
MKNKPFFTLLLCPVLAASTQAYTPEYDSNTPEYDSNTPEYDSNTPEYDSNGELTLLVGNLSRSGDISIVDIGVFASAWL